MSWLKNILIAIDQLGNAICGGNHDATISARVGYFNRYGAIGISIYWRLLRTVIDFTFYPIDGRNHCQQAWLNDRDEKHYKGNDLARAMLGVVVIISCVLISVVTWTYQGYRSLK